MNMKLNKITIENFKGIKSFEVELNGENAVVKAENGVGKTTIYDAFLWLLFGKNSEGKADFEIRPLDGNNQPLKGLVTVVEAVIECDGKNHTLRKELHERVVKKQIRGYETVCKIDEVPKKIGEYNAYIAALIPEDTFKLLTDLNYFGGKMHWTDRRSVLLDMVSEIGTPDGFDELLDKLNDRTIDEYKKVLAGQKKGYEKERDEINPRIDELQKGLGGNGYVDKLDTEEIARERVRLRTRLVNLDTKRKELLGQEKQRQEAGEQVYILEKKKARREAELANDTSNVKKYLDEKNITEVKVAKLKQEVIIEDSTVKDAQSTLGSLQVELEKVRQKFIALSEAEVTTNCYACGQKVPDDRLAENAEKRKAEIAEVVKKGNNLKAAIVDGKRVLKELNEELQQARARHNDAEAAKQKRFAEIDTAIAADEKTPPEKDSLWQALCFDIKEAEAQIGEPVAESLEKIERERDSQQDYVTQLDKALAHADRIKQDKARIVELEEREKELAEKIAEIDGQLTCIDDYKTAESRLIEDKVNGMFKYVEFKLFDRLLNGGMSDCCEATLAGVPYSDMSAGQKIFAGIDIVNVLSEHYGISVPMFIDHAESLTLPIEADTQTIRLFAEKKTRTLIVEREGAYTHV